MKWNIVHCEWTTKCECKLWIVCKWTDDRKIGIHTRERMINYLCLSRWWFFPWFEDFPNIILQNMFWHVLGTCQHNTRWSTHWTAHIIQTWRLNIYDLINILTWHINCYRNSDDSDSVIDDVEQTKNYFHQIHIKTKIYDKKDATMSIPVISVGPPFPNVTGLGRLRRCLSCITIV